MQHGHRERPADPGSEGAALPMPTRKDTKSSKLSPPAESLCILCNGTEGKSVAPDFISMSPQESLSWSADTAESCHILTSLAESVRHAQKSMDFHCNRIVSLAGRDGDLAGHVLCASKGAAEVVSELCNAIAETLLDVKVYKGQLESMFKSIALGRERASENLDIQEETGVTFGENHDSEETLSNPEAFLPTSFVAKDFVDVAVEEAIEIDTSEEARKKEGYSRIRSLLRAGSKMSDLGRETQEGPFSWSVFFREMVKSPQFDLTFAVLIFLSSLVMALQVQYRGFDVGFDLGYFGVFQPANQVWPGAEPIFNGLEMTLGVTFLFEILVRMLAARCHFWCDPWNIMDLFVVVAWAVDTATSASLPVDPMLLRLLRLIKLFRLLRLIRKVKGFDSLYIMVTSIKASFSALLWSTVLLFAVLATIALVLTTLVDVYLNNDSNPLEGRSRVFEYYGTFTRCSLTLLELTLANWVPASRVLTEDVSEFYTIFVLTFQASMGFSVVKVIMGVFLQNTFSVAANDDVIMMNSKDRALQTHKLKMSILFSAADINGDGRLDSEEFADILADPMVSRWLSAMGFDTSIMGSEEIFDLLKETDATDLSAEDVQWYSQVFWKSLQPVDLPEDIVKRFDGKGMAVVGFEIDQVRRTDKGDVSVPITVAYNHHFESTMIGKAASFEREELQGPNDPRAHGAHGHGAPLNWRPGDEHWVVREPMEKAGDLPHSQAFGGANGGEFRKSFHGYAPGFVQVIQSPTQMQITPMQIDTWHREKMNISHPSRFVSGPVPRTSLAPTTGPDALYSGLLECPLTTRITKHVQSNAKIHIGAPCSSQVASGDECMEIARAVLPKHRFAPLQTSQEVGCFVAGDASEFDLLHVSFKAPHGREAFALHQELRGRRPTPQALCGSDAQRFVGNSNPLVNVSVDLDLVHDVATISLQGPKDVWFGVGFNALTMSDQPWAIIVDGNGEVTERKLGYHQPGTLLKPSVKVVESKAVGSLRSVVLTRSLKGASPDYYTFKPLDAAEINFINAVGSGPTLSYHQHRTIGQLTLLPVTGAGACLCKGAPVAFGDAKGTMEYTASGPGDEGSGSVAFNNHCAPQPRSDLLAMKNPTCDLRNYSGGQIACHHMWSLLDADQPIPWTDQPLEYSLKFRFWVEDYDETYHTVVRRVTWGIASPVEYDVPKCAEGVMGCSMENGTWIHTIHGTFTGEGHLAAAHFHCHAPTCLSMQMYRCPLGTKVCNATTGTLLCEERPRYGHGEDDFGEPGYILQPPCLWGSRDFGLEDPPSVEGYVLGTVKTSNASYGHHVEMAWQQMYIFDKHTSQNYV